MNDPCHHLPEFSSLVALLRYRALHQSDRLGYTWVRDGVVEWENLTYGELDRRSRRIAAALQGAGLAGERALLLYPPGLDYLAAFFGCLYAGAIAVPAYPPRHRRNTTRIQAIARDSEAAIALTTTSHLAKLRSLLAQNCQDIDWLATDELPEASEANWHPPALTRDSLAFLQYTSGSTGTPKGVAIAHGNLLHNLALIYQYFDPSPHTKVAIWLPPYHDMGLIGGLLQPLYANFPTVLMSPVDFLQQPLNWLQTISRYRVTTSGGPNFAYDLCVRKITPEQRQHLDLSSWELAFTGAEPIRAETLERFAATFAPCGFRASAFYPCYGMAESTLLISGSNKSLPPVVRSVAAAALAQNRVVTVSDTHPGARKLVSCGQSHGYGRVKIVDPQTLKVYPEGRVGEIWVSSPSVARGYWNQPEATEKTFRACIAETGEGYFLRTGDLGFLQAGELFVTGRLKDIIIIRGRNYYPQDIEDTVENSHPSLRPGCSAAFTVDQDGGERLVVACEIERRHRQILDVETIAQAIGQAVSEQHGLSVDAVVLLKTASIPKTSSGKIQRYAIREGFIDESLSVVGEWRREREQQPFSSTSTAPVIDLESLRLETSDRREQLLLSYIQSAVAQVARLEPAQLDVQQPLNYLGLDSLMAVELKNRLNTELGIEVPMVKFIEGLSAIALAKLVGEQLTQAQPNSSSQYPINSSPEIATEEAKQMLANLHQLADEEVDALLSSMLSEAER